MQQYREQVQKFSFFANKTENKCRPLARFCIYRVLDFTSQDNEPLENLSYVIIWQFFTQ